LVGYRSRDSAAGGMDLEQPTNGRLYPLVWPASEGNRRRLEDGDDV